ncbi:MAG: bifunctional 2-methylcitrate synthase/citrate synthase [Micavibrio sp.]|nr:MAG: bifunctional 2-methylcitrate synthase/citrate synthase [Micavibrio sp.]
MSGLEIFKGLAGVYVDTTAISTVVEDTNTLTYRGYAVQDLAKYCSFEDVAYLLWHGELPNAEERAAFEKHERSLRAVDPACLDVLRLMNKDAHPMDTLRTAISFLGANDPAWADNSPAANLDKSVNMLAKLPVLVAADFRIKNGKEPVAPRTDLSLAENFFHMCFENVPEPEIVKAFDMSLTFYAEHSFNASTFTARTIISSLSDIYAAVTGAIGSLKGPLHGGANEAVMHMLLEIDTPEKAQDWIDDALANKKLVMGFGHRVYRDGDSRVPYMTEVYHKVAKLSGGEKWVEISNILEKTFVERKGIYPNLDFPVGPTYYMMGFDIPIFTPIFVMSRITGWTAHIIEQLDDNKLMRPLSLYNGIPQRDIPDEHKKQAA